VRRTLRQTVQDHGASQGRPGARKVKGFQRSEGGRGESGAVLILALAYILSVSFIVVALSTWATNDLNNTTQFASARSMNYAASNAVQLAIQSIRYNILVGPGQTLGASPPSYCWGTSSTAPSHLLTNGVDINVFCSTAENLASAQTRTVTISACRTTVSAGACATNPLLQAVVVFNDYPPGGSPALTTSCSQFCGTGATLETWNWGTTSGFTSGLNANLISVTSTAPSAPTVGGATYSPSATATSGDPVVISSSTQSVCSVAGGTVTFNANGTCTLSFNDAGNANYNAATPVQQTFTVGKFANSITVTSTAPNNATAGGAPYFPGATATSGDPVVISSSTQSVCSVAGGTVSFVANGTCTLNFNDAGNSTYAAATQVQQSFAVGGPVMTATVKATGTETNDSNTITSSAFTAPSGSLVLVLVAYANSVSQSCNTAVSGGALTSSSLLSNPAAWDTTGQNFRMCAYSATGTGSSGTATVTFGGNANYGALQVVAITGDSSASIGLFSSNSSGSSSAPVFTLGATPGSTSSEVLFGDLTNGSSGPPTWSPSTPAGFTQVGTQTVTQGTNTFSTAAYFGPALSPVTGATSSAAAYGTIGIEIKP
jgi:hypothetical protein